MQAVGVDNLPIDNPPVVDMKIAYNEDHGHAQHGHVDAHIHAATGTGEEILSNGSVVQHNTEEYPSHSVGLTTSSAHTETCPHNAMDLLHDLAHQTDIDTNGEGLHDKLSTHSITNGLRQSHGGTEKHSNQEHHRQYDSLDGSHESLRGHDSCSGSEYGRVEESANISGNGALTSSFSDDLRGYAHKTSHHSESISHDAHGDRHVHVGGHSHHTTSVHVGGHSHHATSVHVGGHSHSTTSKHHAEFCQHNAIDRLHTLAHQHDDHTVSLELSHDREENQDIQDCVRSRADKTHEDGLIHRGLDAPPSSVASNQVASLLFNAVRDANARALAPTMSRSPSLSSMGSGLEETSEHRCIPTWSMRDVLVSWVPSLWISIVFRIWHSTMQRRIRVRRDTAHAKALTSMAELQATLSQLRIENSALEGQLASSRLTAEELHADLRRERGARDADVQELRTHLSECRSALSQEREARQAEARTISALQSQVESMRGIIESVDVSIERVSRPDGTIDTTKLILQLARMVLPDVKEGTDASTAHAAVEQIEALDRRTPLTVTSSSCQQPKQDPNTITKPAILSTQLPQAPSNQELVAPPRNSQAIVPPRRVIWSSPSRSSSSASFQRPPSPAPPGAKMIASPSSSKRTTVRSSASVPILARPPTPSACATAMPLSWATPTPCPTMPPAAGPVLPDSRTINLPRQDSGNLLQLKSEPRSPSPSASRVTLSGSTPVSPQFAYGAPVPASPQPKLGAPLSPQFIVGASVPLSDQAAGSAAKPTPWPLMPHLISPQA